MITAQCHKSRLRGQSRHSLAATKLLERLSHLLTSNVVVDGSDRNITAVNNLGPVLVRVDTSSGVEATHRRLASRCRANGSRSEAGSWTVAHGRVEWTTDDGNVIGLSRLSETLDMVEVGKGVDAGEWPLRRCQYICLTRYPRGSPVRGHYLPRNPISVPVRQAPPLSTAYHRDHERRLWPAPPSSVDSRAS